MQSSSSRSRPGEVRVGLVLALVAVLVAAAAALALIGAPGFRPLHVTQIERAIVRRLTPRPPVRPERQVSPSDASAASPGS